MTSRTQFVRLEFRVACPPFEVVDYKTNPILGPVLSLAEDETNPTSPPGLDAIPMSAGTEVRGGAKVKFSGQARCKLRGATNAARF